MNLGSLDIVAESQGSCANTDIVADIQRLNRRLVAIVRPYSGRLYSEVIAESVAIACPYSYRVASHTARCSQVWLRTPSSIVSGWHSYRGKDRSIEASVTE